MSSARLITKYPNRRLYDNRESRYVTLRDVRNLVLNRTEFSVIERTSGKDITRSILLQVIAELEKQGEAVMSRDFLSQVIRSYGNVVPGIAADYLEQSMKFFLTQQKNFRDQMRRMVGGDPFAAVADIAQKNIARWKALQDEVLNRFARGGRPDGAPSFADLAGRDPAGRLE